MKCTEQVTRLVGKRTQDRNSDLLPCTPDVQEALTMRNFYFRNPPCVKWFIQDRKLEPIFLRENLTAPESQIYN